ncbi:MAG: bifunctional glutamate N-acetyltransferase/amino-acid acetyltransferase ArgJ [Oscillospiraceae bacterium]|jgi:glutamate N-acetyltransferase/amino-acid N-acetyltransferase|nr:bifunctional glutamate N-acetyltransferase/amino-acid acetyltransferase ArgJ [Oscillospiraceae bacterium]
MEKVKWIDGGVCAPKGFRASGVHAGVKSSHSVDPNSNTASEKPDLALILADKPCDAAAVFTKNVVKAAPVLLSRERIGLPPSPPSERGARPGETPPSKRGEAPQGQGGVLQAVILNSGNANACAPNDYANAVKMSKAIADALGISEEIIGVASTGVIGQELNIGAITAAIPELIGALGDNSDAAAKAIMTTDTVKKEFAVETEIGGKTVRIGGIAKGSGMIHPNMGTMLSVITTDCAISRELLDKVLRNAVCESFNRISVDGDTSTNDTCFILASGDAGNAEITLEDNYGSETWVGSDAWVFEDALCALCVKLAVAMASDGEGAKHLITCVVSESENEPKAEAIAKSVISSSLVKSMIFGEDANWGRVLCAMGYSGESFNPERVDVTFRSKAGEVAVCNSGRGLMFDEDLAKKVLSEHDIEILISLNEETAPGEFGWCMCWGCDLTYEYVKINGDYRT